MNNNFILPPDALGAAIEEAYMEVRRAKSIHGPQDFNSTHEGYAILLEEVRELEGEVFFGKKKARTQALTEKLVTTPVSSAIIHQRTEELHKKALREEAIQVAAMALRFASELTLLNK